MNARLATVLSIVGVLAAGSLAAVVNAQALSGADKQADTSLPDLAVTETTTNPTDTTTSTAPTTTAVAADGRWSFNIADAGTLTVDTANGVIHIAAVAPAIGWHVANALSVSDTVVQAVFASPDRELTATAVLAAGSVTATIEASSVATTTAPSSAPTVVDGTLAPVTTTAPPVSIAPTPVTTVAAPRPNPTTAPAPTPTVVPPPPTAVPTSTPTTQDDDLVDDTHGEEPDD